MGKALPRHVLDPLEATLPKFLAQEAESYEDRAMSGLVSHTASKQEHGRPRWLPALGRQDREHQNHRPRTALRAPALLRHTSSSTLEPEGWIQLQDKDESFASLKLVQQHGDQWVAQLCQYISLLISLGARPAPQGDELGSTEHLVALMLHPLHEAEHAPGKKGAHAGFPRLASREGHEGSWQVEVPGGQGLRGMGTGEARTL